MTDCRICGTEQDGFMCRPCAGEVRRALGDAKWLMHEVSNVATGQTRVYRANGKPQPLDDVGWIDEYRKIPAWLRSPVERHALIATRPMVNLHARELLWEAGNTLSTWARDLAESRGILEIPNDWLTWMTDNADSFRWSEEAEQAHDEITYLHKRLSQAVDRSPSRLWAGPCHNELGASVEAFDDLVRHGKCQRDLYAWPGADEIKCDGHRSDEQGCGATHTPVGRREWLLDELEDALLPIKTLRGAVPKLFPELTMPSPATWRSWTFRGRLLARTVVDGTELFRGGDVIELVRDEGMRSGPRRTTNGRMSA